MKRLIFFKIQVKEKILHLEKGLAKNKKIRYNMIIKKEKEKK